MEPPAVVSQFQLEQSHGACSATPGVACRQPRAMLRNPFGVKTIELSYAEGVVPHSPGLRMLPGARAAATPQTEARPHRLHPCLACVDLAGTIRAGLEMDLRPIKLTDCGLPYACGKVAGIELIPQPPSPAKRRGLSVQAFWPPLLPGTVDFRLGNRSLPLKKGGQEGFDDAFF